MSPDQLVFSYVFVCLGIISAAGLYTEMRRRQFRPSGVEDRIFRCDKCGLLYTDDPDMDRSRCAHCGTMNEAVEF